MSRERSAQLVSPVKGQQEITSSTYIVLYSADWTNLTRKRKKKHALRLLTYVQLWNEPSETTQSIHLQKSAAASTDNFEIFLNDIYF